MGEKFFRWNKIKRERWSMGLRRTGIREQPLLAWAESKKEEEKNPKMAGEQYMACSDGKAEINQQEKWRR